MDRQRWIIRTACWGAAIVLLMILALRDLGPSRTIALDARLDRGTPAISMFGPPSRVELGPDRVQVIGEPVYVRVRLPRWFRRVTIELHYENSHALPFRIGVRTHPAEWRFDFVPITYDRTVNGFWSEGRATVFQSSNDAVTIQVPFTLERAWQVERNVHEFIVSTPGVSPERPMTIRSLRVIAERDPICLARWCL